MDEDKKKICDWIMKMDIEDFYCICEVIEKSWDFTGEPLFYTCDVCGEEHEDCDGMACRKFFYEHYGEEYKGVIE